MIRYLTALEHTGRMKKTNVPRVISCLLARNCGMSDIGLMELIPFELVVMVRKLENWFLAALKLQNLLFVYLFVCLMVVNATFNNILGISWWSGLLLEETGGPGDNHRPVASHWQTLSHNAVHLVLIEIRINKNSYSKLKIREKMSVIFHQHDGGILNVFMYI